MQDWHATAVAVSVAQHVHSTAPGKCGPLWAVFVNLLVILCFCVVNVHCSFLCYNGRRIVVCVVAGSCRHTYHGSLQGT